jgi:hypothetical protein
MTLAFASCLISFEEREVFIFFSSSSDEISITSCRCSRCRFILNFYRNHPLHLTAFLFFIGATVIIQLIKNSHYIWTQNKKMLYALTRDHNASMNADYTNEVCRLRLSMRDHVTLGRQSTRIVRHCSYIKIKFIKNFCSSSKTLAIQGTTVLYSKILLQQTLANLINL